MKSEAAVLQTVRLLRRVGKEYKKLETKKNRGAISDEDLARFYILHDGLSRCRDLTGDPPSPVNFAMNITAINSVLCSLI